MEIIKRNTDYALRALVYLSNLKENETRSVKEISADCDVPEIFLRKILQKLQKGGFVQSTRGPEGGFSLSKSPDSITVLEIIEKMQGKFAVNKCFLGNKQCCRQNKCILKSKLEGVQNSMINLIKSTTLEMMRK